MYFYLIWYVYYFIVKFPLVCLFYKVHLFVYTSVLESMKAAHLRFLFSRADLCRVCTCMGMVIICQWHCSRRDANSCAHAHAHTQWNVSAVTACQILLLLSPVCTPRPEEKLICQYIKERMFPTPQKCRYQ